MEPEKIATTVAELLARSPAEIIAAWLFGSVARGSARDTSDVDVAILLAHPPERTLDGLHLDLEAEFERALGRPVQLVVLNRAPVDLIHRVLRDGQLLLERDRSARIRFEVRARNEWFDLAPLRRLYRHGTKPAA